MKMLRIYALLLATVAAPSLALDPPTDPLFTAEEGANQWYLAAIGLDDSSKSAWRTAKKRAPVVVAVVDVVDAY